MSAPARPSPPAPGGAAAPGARRRSGSPGRRRGAAPLVAAALATVLAATGAAPGTRAQQGEARPGDGFREAARDYDRDALEAVRHAVDARADQAGRLLELAAVLHQLASIKREAARLADADRGEEMDWSEYERLGERRDRLAAAALAGRAVEPGAGPGAPAPGDDHPFLRAARDYEEDAAWARERAARHRGETHDRYAELADVLTALAAEKREAARSEVAGREFDWSRHQDLEARREELVSALGL